MLDMIAVEEMAAVQSSGAIVVDVRPMAAYNGWALGGEARGGHIPGAIAFPLAWFDDLDESDLRRTMEEKGIQPAGSVVVYGDGRDDAMAAALRLEELGFSSVHVLDGGLPAWAAGPDRPVDRLHRYNHLVHVQWLERLIGSDDLPLFEGRPHVLAHANFDNRDDYDQGHIAGAIALDTLFLEEPEHWNSRSPGELEKALTSHGITCDTTVVLYGRYGEPTMEQEQPGQFAGQIAAMRAGLLLLYAGVKDVRILDGGIAVWQSAGHAISTEATAPTPVEAFGCDIPARPDFLVDTEEAKVMLADPMSELVSMRSWREFIGEVSGYHYVGPRGRIPGAVFGNCGSDAYHMQNYRNHDNTMLDYRQIASSWLEVGIVPEKRIAFYCGTGWRASEAFFYAWLMGWDRIAVYDGGWFEWSIDGGNPVETGIPDGPIIGSRRY